MIIDKNYIIARTLNQTIIDYINDNEFAFHKIQQQVEDMIFSVVPKDQFCCKWNIVYPEDFKFLVMKLTEMMIMNNQTTSSWWSCDCDTPNWFYVSSKSIGDVSVSYKKLNANEWVNNWEATSFFWMTLNEQLSDILARYTEKYPIAWFFWVTLC